VTGGFQWEIPWTRWASSEAQQNSEAGFLRPHPCPDCGGTGALLELETVTPRITLPSRRGLRPGNTYAEHVQLTLQAQAMGRN